MINMVTDHSMLMANTESPCALIQIISIGAVTPEMNKNTIKVLSNYISNQYKIEASRIFVHFTDVDREMIGKDSKMFDEILGKKPVQNDDVSTNIKFPI